MDTCPPAQLCLQPGVESGMLQPLPASQWNEAAAAHLLRRAGFGGTPAEARDWAELGVDGAVDRLVDWDKTPDPTPDPEWAKPDPGLLELRREMRTLSEMERRAKLQEIQRTHRQNLQDLRRWWLERMRTGPRPLQEKLTLFWHGHFATSVQKVREPYFMWRQNDLFRRLGAGKFRDLLLEVGRDPAMLIWLDGMQSRKGTPNENYGRELLELFTLGEGHYSEDDIKAAARAFTGWTVNRFRQEAVFQIEQHDGGRKTFLGIAGNLKDEDIVEQILKQRQCARFLAAKLWTFFAYERPEPALTEALADVLVRADYEIRPLLRTLFRSAEFYGPRALGTQIKSPVQWLIGTLRIFGVRQFPDRSAVGLLNQLGQHLFEPPSVKGWDGGRAWISTNTLLLRQNAAHLLLHGGDPGGVMFNREELRARVEKLQELRNFQGGQAPSGDDNLERVERVQQRMKDGRLRMPPLLSVAQLAVAEDRADRTRLVDVLAARLLAAPPGAAARKAFDEQAARIRLPADDSAVKDLAYQMMACPEYQLT